MSWLRALRERFAEMSGVGKAGVVLLLLAPVVLVVALLLPGREPPPTETEAREQLKLVLDRWAATSAEEFAKAHPDVAFSDVGNFKIRLLSYEIGSSRVGPGELPEFDVGLTFQQKDGGELKVDRKYLVSRTRRDGRERWEIAGRKP